MDTRTGDIREFESKALAEAAGFDLALSPGAAAKLQGMPKVERRRLANHMKAEAAKIGEALTVGGVKAAVKLSRRERKRRKAQSKADRRKRKRA